MIESLVIELVGKQNKKYGLWLSSLFHGVLMQLLDPCYVDKLHKQQMHPYSQSIQIKDHHVFWRVNALNQEAGEQICNVLKDDSLKSVRLEHENESFEIVSRTEECLSYQELLSHYYFATSDSFSRYLNIRILTPASFKQNGQYVVFPSVRLIFQSLMNKYDQASKENQIYTDDLLEHFEQHARITDYRLHSVRFHLEGVRIPAFAGDITIRIDGPRQMVNAAWMLAKFGCYSGVGIKTGMGMGALTLSDSHKRTGKANLELTGNCKMIH